MTCKRTSPGYHNLRLTVFVWIGVNFAEIYDSLVFKQWRIQDFPEGLPTPKGAKLWPRLCFYVPPKKLSFRFRISLSDMTNYKSADF